MVLNLTRHGVVLGFDHADQDVRRFDQLAAELNGLSPGRLERALGRGGEREPVGGRLRQIRVHLPDPGAHQAEVHAHHGELVPDRRVFELGHAEEQMLRADRGCPDLNGGKTRERQREPAGLTEVLDHRPMLSPTESRIKDRARPAVPQGRFDLPAARAAVRARSARER